MNIVSSVSARQDAVSNPAAHGNCARWVSFELAGQQYAIAILKVLEVLSGVDIEPVPCAPPTVLGVINLRGSIVTVLDLGVWLGLEQTATNHCIIVVNHEDQAVGVRVDRILEVLDIQQSAINPVPATAASNTANTVLGYVKCNEDLLTLLEFTRLPDTADLAHAA